MERKTRRSFLRRTLLPVTAAAAAALGVTAAAPGEARAEMTPQTLAYEVSMNIILTVFGDGLSMLWGSSSTLSAADLATIEADVEQIMTGISQEQYNAATTDLATTLGYLKNYTAAYDTATCSDLTTKYNDLTSGTGYIGTAYNAMQEFGALVGVDGDGYTMTAIAGYSMAATAYLTLLKEKYQLAMAMNVNSYCQTQGTKYTWGTTMDTALGTLAQQAGEIVSNLRKWAGWFEGQFPASTYLHTSTSWGYVPPSVCGYTDTNQPYRTRVGTGNYCFDYTPYEGSATTFCPTTTLASTTSSVTGLDSFDVADCGTYVAESSTAGTAGLVNGDIYLQQMKMYYRDNQLGAGFYETLAAIQKIANGSFEYCGNGTCAIGEVSWCSQDCGSEGTSTKFGTSTLSTSASTTFSTSQPQTLVSLTGGGGLNWQGDGNLVLYDSSGTAVWSSHTQGSATSLTFDPKYYKDTGKAALRLTDSSGNVVWQSWPSDESQSQLATKMVLLDGDAYLVDDYGGVWWSTASDFHYVNAISTAPNGDQTGNNRFCLSGTTTEYLIWETSAPYGLVWYNGDLIVQPPTSSLGSSIAWHTNTGGRGNYLCVQEDGNMAVYGTSSATALWSTNSGNVAGSPSFSTRLTKSGLAANSATPNAGLATTTAGWGGQLVLVGDQLRLLSAAGEPMWSSPSCNTTRACGHDNQVAVAAVTTSGTCWPINSILFDTEYAQLIFQSDGNLVVYDKTPSEILNPDASWFNASGDTAPPTHYYAGWTPLWATGTYGKSASGVCLGGDGNLVVYNSSGSALWSAGTNGTSVKDLVLAGCNLMLTDATGQAIAATGTTCSYYDANKSDTYFKTSVQAL